MRHPGCRPQSPACLLSEFAPSQLRELRTEEQGSGVSPAGKGAGARPPGARGGRGTCQRPGLPRARPAPHSAHGPQAAPIPPTEETPTNRARSRLPWPVPWPCRKPREVVITETGALLRSALPAHLPSTTAARGQGRGRREASSRRRMLSAGALPCPALRSEGPDGGAQPGDSKAWLTLGQLRAWPAVWGYGLLLPGAPGVCGMETPTSQTRRGLEGLGLCRGRQGRGRSGPPGRPCPQNSPPWRAVPTPLALPRAAGDRTPLLSSHKPLFLPDSSPLPPSFRPSCLPSRKF